MYPQPVTRKRSALAILGVALLAAGCGGGGKHETTTRQAGGQQLSGEGFAFTAPGGWQVERAARAVTAKQGGGPTLVSVTVLDLRRAYRPELFPKVTVELDKVAGTLATKLRGELAARRTVAVAGGRVRQYEIAYERNGKKLRDRLTFVLRGRREYFLLCRWEAGAGRPPACDQLVSTFRIG